MNDFDYENMQKKRLANMAKYKKNGSKSKQCKLSTDYMTRKQWEKRNGEIMTYQFGKPMQWGEFKTMPVHIQNDYLMRLIEKYQIGATDIARMFGVNIATILRFAKKDGINVEFSRGHRVPADCRDAFEKFLSGENANADIDHASNTAELGRPDRGECPDGAAHGSVLEAMLASKKDATCAKPEPEEAPDCEDSYGKATSSDKPSKMKMTEFSFSFSGGFDPKMLYNSLMAMLLPMGSDARVSIKCAVEV